MEPHTNLKLLFIALALTISATSANSRLPPGISPILSPYASPSPSPSPSPSQSLSQSQSMSQSQSLSQSQSQSQSQSLSQSQSQSQSQSLSPSPSPSPSLSLSPSASPSVSPSPSPFLDFSAETNELTVTTDDDSDDTEEEPESPESPEPESPEPESPDGERPEIFNASSDESDADADADADEAFETESLKAKSPSKKSFGIDFAADLHVADVDPELKKICEQTDHSSLCLATAIPQVKEKPDVDTVLQVAVQAGSDFAKVALAEAKKMSEKPGTPEDLLTTLKDCQDGYDTAVENFQKALDAFATNDVGTMRSMLSAVITYVGGCQDEFKQMRVDSPLAGYSEKLNEMASNCLALASLKST